MVKNTKMENAVDTTIITKMANAVDTTIMMRKKVNVVVDTIIMKIRKAERKDIPTIEKLLYEVHALHAKGRSDIFKEGKKKYEREELFSLLEDEKNPIYVAVDEKEEVKGYLFLQFQIQEESNNTNRRKILYIDDLCVEEKERGKGVGTLLYTKAQEIAKKEGFDALTLHVYALNESALAFYQKIGMKPLYTVMEERMK
ncbi:MAG: GNAT family N-acetyltransferase [Bacilli bacterium]|nr:GNAT family N-acetyltransferase [Bacilli bacterium]